MFPVVSMHIYGEFLRCNQLSHYDGKDMSSNLVPIGYKIVQNALPYFALIDL